MRLTDNQDNYISKNKNNIKSKKDERCPCCIVTRGYTRPLHLRQHSSSSKGHSITRNDTCVQNVKVDNPHPTLKDTTSAKEVGREFHVGTVCGKKLNLKVSVRRENCLNFVV